MEWNNKYTYPKSSRSIENGYRKYFFGDEKLPSVTTILSATKSEEEKAALTNEQYKNMAKEIIEKGIKGRLHEIYGMEETLYYPEQYAGTADLIGFYEGKDVVVDFKQANKPKKVDYIQDYFLQLGAYTLAHDVVHQTKMKAGIILLCTKDNLFQEFKIEGAELEMYQNLFMGRVKKFYEMNNIS